MSSLNKLQRSCGLSLIELMITVVLAGLLLSGLLGLVNTAFKAYHHNHNTQKLHNEVNFAMQRIKAMATNSSHLFVPLIDNPQTSHNESQNTALAFAMSSDIDRDQDGFPDIDNDRDGLINEDPKSNLSSSLKAGIALIDDDNDGQIDEGVPADDDEDGATDEDPINYIDDDGDGSVDEDPPADLNDDLKPGLADVDDDGDDSIDEGSLNDDDEDGSVDEDGVDTVSYYLDNGMLCERLPKEPHELAYEKKVLLENVTKFDVIRHSNTRPNVSLVTITLEAISHDGLIATATATLVFGDDY